MFAKGFNIVLNEKNLTAYRVAKETGISQGLMNEYKSGKKIPTVQNLVKIADFLNCSIDVLVGRETSCLSRTKFDEEMTEMFHDITAQLAEKIGRESNPVTIATAANLLARLYDFRVINGLY